MRPLTPTERGNIINAKTIAAWSDEEALSYLDEFGVVKAEAGLDLMSAGMDPADAVNTLRLDSGNQLLSPMVRSIVLAGWRRSQKEKMGTVAEVLGRCGQWRKAQQETGRKSGFGFRVKGVNR